MQHAVIIPKGYKAVIAASVVGIKREIERCKADFIKASAGEEKRVLANMLQLKLIVFDLESKYLYNG